MQVIHYRYSESELKKILSTLEIIVDTREQKNQHVLEYFRKKKVPFNIRTMKTGDYSAMIPKNPEMGIMKDTYLTSVIERKNGVDELVQSIKDRSRFENELIRASQNPFVLIVEDAQGYQKILKGEYRSQYKPESLLGSLKTFEVRYGFSVVYIPAATTGNYIYHRFLYTARELLKKGFI
ncbi:ERCC4 domain-containing protein [Bacillus thuringiensis]|uniref:ERCC4 domain-containing protein n=1 Tax=Bacillus thuringiensis TaxID=1428 RepID=UPI0026E34D73|nr:ERCC4 domain-containing protein [Bacillus thuringiensis]MDO6631783.1 ERCC4 domain-containing protein [Bacillus thuringiensis]MDO6661386.1 ERCC4 domain-containing protein [Bacillus thuringiensis]MDO6701923.1 ERCC4 domain-containing protein [Bacillus thuringiensis]